VYLKARLKALEQHRKQVSKEPFRVLIRSVCGPPNLATSTCERRLGRDAQLTEIVHLDGGRDDFTDEQLEKWIATFPIEAPP
jgi:hypothetical protein